MALLFINIIGIALILTIVWWFWLFQPRQKLQAVNQLDILVENGVYQPSQITVPAHKAFTMRFTRKDPSNCAEQVLFPDLDISEYLPLGHVQDIQLPALEPGRYGFQCQMQMYKGEVEAV